jgi:effector-binding domain-containing protein
MLLERDMLDTPEIVLTEPRRAAVIRLTIPRAEIREAMYPAIQELLSVLAEQGLAPAGAVFSHHFRMDPEFFDFHAGVPGEGTVLPAGRVAEGKLPEVKAVRAGHHGPYEELGAAWGELQAWVASRGLAPASDLWESYLTGPESGPDPAGWRTELVQPLLG